MRRSRLRVELDLTESTSIDDESEVIEEEMHSQAMLALTDGLVSRTSSATGCPTPCHLHGPRHSFTIVKLDSASSRRQTSLDPNH
jgi:hypothetical protein